MFVTMNRIPVNPEFREAFEKRFAERLGLVDKAPGFIRNMVLRPLEDTSDRHIVLTFWESKEAFLAWARSKEFKEAHSRARQAPEGMYLGPGKIEVFETVLDSGG